MILEVYLGKCFLNPRAIPFPITPTQFTVLIKVCAFDWSISPTRIFISIPVLASFVLNNGGYCRCNVVHSASIQSADLSYQPPGVDTPELEHIHSRCLFKVVRLIRGDLDMPDVPAIWIARISAQ